MSRTNSRTLAVGFTDTHPCKERKDGAPSVFVVQAKSKAWATLPTSFLRRTLNFYFYFYFCGAALALSFWYDGLSVPLLWAIGNSVG